MSKKRVVSFEEPEDGEAVVVTKNGAVKILVSELSFSETPLDRGVFGEHHKRKIVFREFSFSIVGDVLKAEGFGVDYKLAGLFLPTDVKRK